MDPNKVANRNARALDLHTIRRRNAHALDELRQRGALRSGALPPALRLAMALFPRLKAPYYGDRVAYAAILGILFGVPMGAFVVWILVLDGQFSGWWGVFGGLAAGAAFGWLFTGYMATVHRRMKLTPWERLDTPPGAEPPEGARTYKEVEREFLSRS